MVFWGHMEMGNILEDKFLLKFKNILGMVPRYKENDDNEKTYIIR